MRKTAVFDVTFNNLRAKSLLATRWLPITTAANAFPMAAAIW
jgi:hypothetical protein